MWNRKHKPKLSIGDIWYSDRYSRDCGYRKVTGFTTMSNCPAYMYVKCKKNGGEFKASSYVICESIDEDLDKNLIRKCN